jgi:rod shape-determining protein MreD
MKAAIAAVSRPRRKSSSYSSRLNREQSAFRMLAIPIITVCLGSMITAMPVIEAQAILPPFGLMIFIAWRLLRPGLWPMWAGLPFGMFDDIFSGQPFGSAALIWSLFMLSIQIIDIRSVWRDHWQDWFIAGIVIFISIYAGMLIVGLTQPSPGIGTILPQIGFSILIYPLVVRLCARLDRWRIAT